MIRHAGLIARLAGGAWRGVLIEGPSGAGKSDLTLRALAEGFRLVADDRTLVFVSQGRLFGRAPALLSGLMEVRGVGVLRWPNLVCAEIVLTAQCVQGPGEEERLAEFPRRSILGVDVPTLDLWPLAASAPVKLACALERVGARPKLGVSSAVRVPGGRVGA